MFATRVSARRQAHPTSARPLARAQREDWNVEGDVCASRLPQGTMSAPSTTNVALKTLTAPTHQEVFATGPCATVLRASTRQTAVQTQQPSGTSSRSKEDLHSIREEGRCGYITVATANDMLCGVRKDTESYTFPHRDRG